MTNARNAKIKGWKEKKQNEKREQAEKRQEKHNALSDNAKINKAQARRGNSTKELKKLKG